MRFSNRTVYLDSASPRAHRVCFASFLANVAKYNELYQKQHGRVLAVIHMRRGINLSIEIESLIYQAVVVRELGGPDRVVAQLIALSRLPHLIELRLQESIPTPTLKGVNDR